MRATSLLRFLFFFFILGAFLLWIHVHYRPSDEVDFLDCPRYSTRCNSKNPIKSKSSFDSSHSATTTRNHESDVPRHPLDPLTIHEINAARAILHSYSPFSSSPYSLTIHSLALDEPPNPAVLAWRPGASLLPRRAAVTALFRGRFFRRPPPRPSPWLPYSDHRRHNHPLGDPACLPSLQPLHPRTRRPPLRPLLLLRQPRLVRHQGVGPPRRRGPVLHSRGHCQLLHAPHRGPHRPLDIDTKEALDFSDVGRDIPIPKAAGTEYRYDVVAARETPPNIRPLNPISMEQPAGPSFVVEGHVVKWAGWEFHLKADARAGVVVSAVNLESGEKRRVMYKGFASEPFVPYMDPTDAGYFKTYMDAGEYWFGHQARSQVPLKDCPRNAYYMDGVFTAADGKPFVRPNMVCLFQRYAGISGGGTRRVPSPVRM